MGAGYRGNDGRSRRSPSLLPIDPDISSAAKVVVPQEFRLRSTTLGGITETICALGYLESGQLISCRIIFPSLIVGRSSRPWWL